MAPMPFGTLLCRRLTDSPSEKDDLPATSSSSHMPVTSAAERPPPQLLPSWISESVFL